MSVTTEQFRIGELARRTGSTPRAVRYYEELGLPRRAPALRRR
jgi:DNA-binding transcriptional MerR regulator